MNSFLSGILTLASIIATMTTAPHIPIEEESRFSDVNCQFEERRRNHHASNAHHFGKKIDLGENNKLQKNCKIAINQKL
jgi:hypothetical protein